MSKDKKMISVELPADLYRELRMLSAADDRSLSAYIRRVLDEHVRNVAVRYE